MLQIGLREANQRFTHYIDTVENGEEVLITRRGKPIAKLVPVSSKKSLTIKQKAALKRTLQRMRKGYDLGGKKFNRDESHAR